MFLLSGLATVLLSALAYFNPALRRVESELPDIEPIAAAVPVAQASSAS
jgi:hypothetical protein